MWSSVSIEETLKKLNVDPGTGLDEAGVGERLLQYGDNSLQAKKRKSILRLFIEQLNDALIFVLLGAVVITAFMGEYIDAGIIMLVIIINAVLGVVQEVKAGNAIDALRKLSTPKALVKRNGRTEEIESEKLVPGDILVLEAGRFIAADLRLIEAASLQIEESALTGESVPVEKDANTVFSDEGTPLGDRANMAFMSTVVTYGRGVGVVVETGMRTEVGKIADIINEEQDDKTPLEIRLDELGKTLGKIAIGVCLLMFVLGWIQGRNLADMFLTAVSLAVASIPEGLAAIVAVVLSIGVTKMARRKAIIKKLPAVETLGSVTVICSDKTGTLTQNKMTVVQYFNIAEQHIELEKKLQSTDGALLLAKAMVLCSDATFKDGVATGDPTEVALLIFGDKLNVDREGLLKKNKRINEKAFDSDRKLMSTLESEDGKLYVYVKGAIDNLLSKCTQICGQDGVVAITDEHRKQFREATDKMSANALRTLAAAYKPVDHEVGTEEMEENLILIGMVGMIDPPRTEVKDSILQAKEAGITTVMITGDHKNTAFAIAKDLGIAERPEQAITGAELEKLNSTENKNGFSDLRVFARVSPEHKVKIVRGFRAQNNIVAMTGDGVNDAPSLNSADIGVAMGVTGTDVAKNASDMILADDNFATIVSAIEQGRNIYSNIKKSVVFLLASNVGEVVAMVAAILAGLPAPLIATQLLWINLLTDTLPAVALGMDPGDHDVMQQPPRDPKESFFAHGAARRIIVGGILIGLLTILAFCIGYIEHGFSPYDKDVPENVHQYARTMAFMTIIACQLLYSLSFRHPTKSIFQSGLFSNKYLIAAIVIGMVMQLLVMGIPFAQQAFKLQLPDAKGWVYTITLGLVPLLVGELIKWAGRVRSRSKLT